MYLRNRKRVACVYGMIMHAGNVGRIREKRVITRRSRVFYTLLEYSPDIPRVHYRTINARDEFFYFFYNISRRYYIVNNFTQKIDVEILLTYAQWRHAHAFTVAWIFKRAKEQNCQNNYIQTFDAFALFCPKLVETTTNSTNAKPVNFTRRTIEICFVSLVYSFLLSGNFCILKAL